MKMSTIARDAEPILARIEARARDELTGSLASGRLFVRCPRMAPPLRQAKGVGPDSAPGQPPVLCYGFLGLLPP